MAQIKTAELEGAALDWAVAKCRSKVSRYLPLPTRIFKQSYPDGTGCRIWKGKLNQHGYGVCKVNGKEIRAHRALFFYLHPEVNKQFVIMHTCDKRACVNPNHLIAGTQTENLEDMTNKGRRKGGAPKGNKNGVGNKGWTKGGITAKYAASKIIK